MKRALMPVGYVPECMVMPPVLDMQVHTHPISTGPHLQRGGLHKQLLKSAHQGALRAHALQLVIFPQCT